MHIFAWALFVLLSCSEENNREEAAITGSAPTLIGYVHHPGQESSTSYISHVEKIASYTKLGMETFSISHFESNDLPPELRVLLINGTTGLSDAGRSKLLKFVASGGVLIFPTVNEDQKAKFLSGLKPEADFEYDLTSQGIHFETNMIPGIKGTSIHETAKNTCLSKNNFSDEITILASASTDRSQPVIIEHEIGDGKVIHFNTSIVLEKVDRGLLFSAMLRGLEGIPFPIVNVASIFIDDFPMPLYEIPAEPVYANLGLTMDRFMLEVWWPDMIALGQRYDISYAAYPCFDYNKVYTAPFPFEEWDRHQTNNGNRIASATYLSRSVISEGHELGIHGYNHESLLRDVWPSGEAIEASWGAVRKKWVLGNHGKLPVSYVPPSNEIDSFGIAHLNKAMPELKYLCSTYDGEFAIGGDRDFDPEPYEPDLFGFPRVSSGYTFSNKKHYAIQSLFLYTGIWTHFIHPDDVYQLPDTTNTSAGKYDYRNAQRLSWRSSDGRKGMLEHFEDYLQRFNSLYPTVEYVTVSEGAERTKEWREMYLSMDENYLLTNTSNPNDRNYSWNIYLENDIQVAKLRAQSVSSSFTRMGNGNLYTVTTEKPELNLPFSPRINTNWTTRQLNELIKDFEGSIENSEEIVEVESLVELEEETPSEEDLEFARMQKLEQNALSLSEPVDSASFQNLVTYWRDQDREMAIWDYLEKAYRSEASAGVKLHDQYQDRYDYPNDTLAKKWLLRVLENDPENEKALQAYNNYFYTSEDQEETGRLYENIHRRTGSKEAYARYIQYLIDYQPQKVTTELAEKNPYNHSELWALSESIAYLYADEQKYEEALFWSDHSTIPLLTRLQWWAELEAYNSMQDAYDQADPTEKNDSTLAFVSNTWLDLGKMEKSAYLANQLPEGKIKEEYKTRLNAEVPNLDNRTQWYLYQHTPDLLDNEQRTSIEKNMRITYGDGVEFTSSYVYDNFEQSNWDNTLTYHLRTPKRNLHSFSGLHSYVSDIQLNEVDVNNLDHTLVGFGYRFQTEENTPKPVVYFNGGLMQGSRSQTFFNLGAGISHATSKMYKSAGITYAPMMTGPSLTREIYRIEFTGYLERDANHFIQPSLAIVGTNYTTDANSLELTGRSYFNLNRTKTARFSPFVEAYGTVANQDQLDGNPFWIIENRYYVGGGSAWTYGKPSMPLQLRFEGGVFADSYTDYFIRLNGEAQYIMKKYTFATARFEIFNQARYFSNGFYIGVKHYLRPRKRNLRELTGR